MAHCDILHLTDQLEYVSIYPSHDNSHASQERAVRSARAPVGHASAQRWAAWRKPSESGLPKGTATATSKPRPTIARPSSSPAAAAMRTQASQLMHLPGS